MDQVTTKQCYIVRDRVTVCVASADTEKSSGPRNKRATSSPAPRPIYREELRAEEQTSYLVPRATTYIPRRAQGRGTNELPRPPRHDLYTERELRAEEQTSYLVPAPRPIPRKSSGPRNKRLPRPPRHDLYREAQGRGTNEATSSPRHDLYTEKSSGPRNKRATSSSAPRPIYREELRAEEQTSYLVPRRHNLYKPPAPLLGADYVACIRRCLPCAGVPTR
ncbi:hypothetical protein EVAR_68726_1 [Eumeta japonica]|uniref:Uncharacterized protein n=1 Tax=Eumeta variegata TaxID=151549 RepID=A0A4C2A324_EUMVA|nr:hypothetical protein EVAR_68726_1 [Eumeta japonica]